MSLPSATDRPLGRARRPRQPIAEQEAVFLRRQPRVGRAGGAGRGARWPAARRRAGRSPSRRPSGSRTARARRSTTSTAPSTSTCTAGTACRWWGTRTRRSSGGHRAGRPRHPLRAADRGRDRRRRGAGPAVRPAAVAVRQLRHRGDHGRRAPDAGADRARPRASRSRAATTATTTRCEVSVLPGGRRDRAGGRGRTGCRATPASRRRSSTWSWSCRSTTLAAVARVLRENPRSGRGHDRRAGDDERRHHPARPRLPRRAPRPAARARRAARLRRGEDRPHHGARAARPRRYGVVPDLVCLAKALGGGSRWPRSAGTEAIMRPSPTAPTSRSAPSTATRCRWPPPGPPCSRC